jgi:hypothetical protein
MMAVALTLVGGGAVRAQPSKNLDAYAIFAVNGLRARSLRVMSGDIGVNAGPLDLRSGLAAPTSVVVADQLQVGTAANCAALYTSLAGETIGACGPAQATSFPLVADVGRGCGIDTSRPPCAAADSMTVPRGATMAIDAGVHGDLDILGAGGHHGRAVLTGGDYVFCSLHLGRSAVLEVDGPARVAVAGDVVIGPGAQVGVGTGMTPGDLTLQVDGAEVAVSRGARLAGRLCAPTTMLRVVGNARLSGSMVAGNIEGARITAEGLGGPPGSTTTTSSTSTTSTTAVHPTTSTSVIATTTTTTTTATTSTTTTSHAPTSTSSTTTASTSSTTTTRPATSTTSTSTSSTSTTTTTTLPPVVCPASGLIGATVTLVPASDGSTRASFSGIKVTLAYPGTVSLPGSGILPVNDPSDPTTRELLLDPELYNGLILFNDTDTTLVTSVVVTSASVSVTGPLPFELARFSCTAGNALAPGGFAATVSDESDALGNVIPIAQRPAAHVTLSP